MRSELFRVRLYSWAGALICAAFAASLLFSPSIRQQADGVSAGAPSIAITTISTPERAAAPPRAPRAQATREDRRARHVAAPFESGAGLINVRLWSYGPRGEIVFDNYDQMQRCAEARRKREDQSDCPSLDERAVLTWNPDARAATQLRLE